MDVEHLRRRLDRRPFLPFRMHLVDGRHFDILDPSWTFAIPPYRRVFIARPQEARGRSSLPIEEIDAIFITSIEDIAADGPTDAGTAAA
jgi:hypothetical protein